MVPGAGVPLAGPEYLGRLSRAPENWKQGFFQKPASRSLLSTLGQGVALFLLGLRTSDVNGLYLFS